MTITPQRTIPIEEIADNIAEQRCVLLLGPNVAINERGEPMQSALLSALRQQELKVSEDVDGLLRFDEATRRRLYTPIKRYYAEHAEPNELHLQLARIPWHLVISLTPDLMLRSALEDLGIEHQFHFYTKRRTPEPITSPSKEKPLLYNLFGSVDEEVSLILTHLDLIQFIFSVMRDFRLPERLRETISDASYFVFLGFDFEKWYLQLLLNLFKLGRDKPSQAAEPSDLTPAQVRDFYGRHYGLQFIDSDFREYVSELYAYCEQAGMLREVSERAEASIKRELRQRLKESQIEGVIDGLADHLEADGSREVFNEVITLSGRYSRLESRRRKGDISQEDGDIELNRIAGALATLIDELPEPSPD